MTGSLDTARLAMLNKAYPPWVGGIEKHVRDCCEALAGRGRTVSALVVSNGRTSRREALAGVDVIRVPRLGTLWSQPLPKGYFKALRSLNPSLLHAHVPFPLAWFAVNALPPGVPVLCTWHSDIVRQKMVMRFLSPFEQRFLRRCNRILVTSPELLESSKPLRPHRGRCEILPLALPKAKRDEKTLSRLLGEYKVKYPGKNVLFVGRLVGYKGLNHLIEAMPRAGARLLIAGDGPLRKHLEQVAARCGAGDRICFLGPVGEDEKTALYRLADVFVLPSTGRNEAFGYVLLEAMAEGCPAISTDIPTGVRWVNRHGETGLVVPPGDSSALAAAINQIVNDKNVRLCFSANGKIRCERDFHFESILDRLESVYGECLAEASSRG